MSGNAGGYVTFVLDDEVVALPLARVSNIVRVPDITPVPRSASSLLGVMNLGGVVLPVADLRRCCGLSPTDLTETTRVIVVDVGTQLGLVADRVLTVRTGSDLVLDDASAARTAVGADLLAGVLHDGDTLISLLDLDALVSRELRGSDGMNRPAPEPMAGGVATPPPAPDGGPARETASVQLVSFVVDAQECAVALEAVREVLRAPAHPMPVPHAAAGVVGIVELHGRSLPLFSLRALLGAPARALDEGQRVLVAGVRATGADEGESTVLVGLVADDVREVLTTDLTDVRPLPEAISEAQAIGVDQICTLDNGRRLIAVLNLERLLGDRVGVSDQEQTTEAETEMDVTAEETGGRQFVAFRVARGEYGLDVVDVHEVARAPSDIVRLPDAPDFIRGLCTIRGAVIPLLDLRARFGEDAAPLGDSARVLVTDSRGHQVGLLVDAVLDVRRVRSDDVVAPDSLTAENTAFVHSVVIDGDGERFMLVIEPSSLLDEPTLEGLDPTVAA